MSRFTEFERENKKQAPVAGYWAYRLVSLEEALKPFLSQINGLEQSIREAKRHCIYPSEHNLTRDESAAVFLYTTEAGDASLYRVLNKILRTEDRNVVKPWFPYLKLLNTALQKLPTFKGHVWRAVPGNIAKGYKQNDLLTWWSISSCSQSTDVVKNFLKPNQEGTLFMIDTLNGKNLVGYNMYPNEQEVVLGIGTKLRVKSIGFEHGNLHVVHLEEVHDDDDDAEEVTDAQSQHQASATTTAAAAVLPKAKFNITLPPNARWATEGVTVAGGHGEGNESNQLNTPWGLYVNEDQTVFIADSWNHRIVEWKRDAKSGRVVAGGNGLGNRTDQLFCPTDVIVDKDTNSLVICDTGNQRVMRWSCRSGTTSGEMIIDNINCSRLMMADNRFLYISDRGDNKVKRYQIGGPTNGIVKAGGNGEGDHLNQLNSPRHIFVDRQYSVYVSDSENHRVMKWVNGATEGIVVAGGRGEGNDLTQLSTPQGVFVDSLGTVYVADTWNHRIMRWHHGATQGTVIVGGNRRGEQAGRLQFPVGLSFDRHGNLYVIDYTKNRVQRFSIETS